MSFVIVFPLILLSTMTLICLNSRPEIPISLVLLCFVVAIAFVTVWKVSLQPANLHE